MSTIITDNQGNRIRQFANARWYVKPAGQTQYSAKASPTADAAQAHLAKLTKGLVQFEPLGSFDTHRPSFKTGFANSASPRNRLHRTH